MTIDPPRFPKIHSPFKREENEDREYVVYDEVNDGYEWVFENDDVLAVEKLHGCFDHRSRVDTKDGAIEISKIVNNEINVPVKSYNFETESVEYREIEEYHKTDTTKDWMKVSISLNKHGGNNRSFVCTKDHKIYTDDGWTEAQYLSEDTTVYTAGDNITYRDKQIIVGSVLGDGTINTMSTNNSIEYTHSVDQENYLDWKRDLISVDSYKRWLGDGGYDGSKERKRVRLSTSSQQHEFINDIAHMGDGKRLKECIIEYLDPFALAVWYMDDGHLNVGSGNQRNRITFSTNSFTENEVSVLLGGLIERYKISGRYTDYGTGYKIEINSDSSQKLFNIMAPYIPECMEYKLPERFHGSETISVNDDSTTGFVEGRITSIENDISSYRGGGKMYDLTVSGNHNYFVGGILVHNSNCAVEVNWGEEGAEIKGFTRHGPEPFQEVDPYSPDYHHRRICRAIQNTYRRGYLDNLGEGVFYGETVGPDFHGNEHELDENLFIPFEWMVDKCSYNSWGKYPKDFDTISEWFEKNLFSLFYARMHGTDLEEASVRNGTFCEGIVFVHPDAGYTAQSIFLEEEELSNGMYRKYAPNMAKLRRDMYDWFEGERH